MFNRIVTVFALVSPLVGISAYAESITANPNPIVSNKPVEIKLSGREMGDNVYLYTWISKINGTSKEPFKWNDILIDKFKLQRSGSDYVFTISNIRDFYGLTGEEMKGLNELSFMMRTGNAQTGQISVKVELGQSYSGGDGSVASPYLISTLEDLKTLAENSSDWSSNFKQTASINGVNFSIGTSEIPFTGSYDGQGYSISGLTLTGETMGEGTGLFGTINGATIKNLAVTGAEVNGMSYVGILVGHAIKGNISECYTTGSVTATSLASGGFVGFNEGATITDCYSTASVSAKNEFAVGGFVGKNEGSISKVFASGKVDGHNYVGGVDGANYGSVDSSVSASAMITTDKEKGNVSRFGGNNNAENSSTNNISWYCMPLSNGATVLDISAWSEKGDNSLKVNADLTKQSTYASSTDLNWDFNNVWEWASNSAGTHHYPNLKVMKDKQPEPFSDEFYTASSIDFIDLDKSNKDGKLQVSKIANNQIKVTYQGNIANIALHNVMGSEIQSRIVSSTDNSVIIQSDYIPMTGVVVSVTPVGKRAKGAYVK